MTTTDIEKAEPEGSGEGGEGTASDLVPAEVTPTFTPAPTRLLEPTEDPKAEAVRTRLLLPLLLPIVSAVMIAFYAINLSRALLAGGSTGALVIASVLTAAVLAGAAWISSRPNLSTGALTVIVVALFGLVGAAGLTTIGAAQEDHEGEETASGYVEPEGEPVASFEVQALPNLKFDRTDYVTTAGINEIVYVGRGGFHTLVFEERELRGFKLEVTGEETDRGKVELESRTYVIYCDVPGHRQAGMEATVTVGDAISE